MTRLSTIKRGVLSDTGETMDEIINPYIAGAPVTEQRMFFGREDIFQWIENSIAGQFADHILVIHGQRRVGKTSVLKQLGNRLPKRFVPVFFDLQGRTHTSLDRFLWWLAREIVRVLKQERGIETPLPEKDDFAKDPDHFENRFLPDLEPLLGNSTLLLTFDEFDNLEESEVKEELARPLVDYLRRLMGQRGLNFIFSIGSSGRKLENMQAEYTEFFKTALYKKISFLNEEQTRHLVTRPVQDVIEYERGAVDRIYQITSGHPYFTQLTCHELFARCQRTEQRKIAKLDVEEILDDVVERGTVNLKFVWDEAADIEKWGLAALAQLDKADHRAVADYLKKQRVRFSETDLTSGLLRLREKDVLTPDNRFVIHLLRLWLQKNRPIEQAREELTEVNPIANRYIEIGLEFKDTRQFAKAIESFQEALAISKDNLQAQVNIALVYVDQKAFDKAVVEFEKALAMDDEDVSARAGLCEAHLALGDSAMTRGRAKEAVLSYQRVLAINAEHLEARGRMAEIARQRAEKALTDGKDEESLSAFAEALRFTPEDQSLIERVEKVRAEKKAKVLAALLARSEKEASAKSWEKSLAALNEALELAPLDESILARIDSVKARQLKERLDAILAKADQAEKSNRWDAAIGALGEYLALQPDDAAIQKRLDNLRAAKRSAWLGAVGARADAALASERWDEAIAALNEVLSLEPGNADFAARAAKVRAAQKAAALRDILRRAEAAALAGRWDETIEALNAGLASEPENETLQAKLIEVRKAKREARLKAALRLADTAAQAGKWDSAAAALNEVLAVEPENAEFQKKLSEIRAQERLSKLNAARTQARSLARAERFEESLKAWDEYLKLDPDDRQAAQAEIESVKRAQGLAQNYAEAYKAYSKKNYDKAIGLFKSIVMEDADYKDATRLLAESVEYRRTARKWWQSRWVWGGIGLVALVIVAWSVFRYGLPLLAALPTATPAETRAAASATTPPPSTAIFTPTLTSTPLPLKWTRLNSGQFLSRDIINAILIDPTDAGVMYVGTKNAGIYKSIDGGVSWQPIHNGLGRAEISTLIMDPNDSKILYAGAILGGVYKTTNGGLTWQAVNAGINIGDGEWLAIVAMDRQDSQHLYFTDSKMLYETTNGGQLWREGSEQGRPPCKVGLVTEPSDGNVLFLASGCPNKNQGGVYKSTDGGRTWAIIGFETQPLDFHGLWIEPNEGQTLYVSSGGTLWVSHDKGETWTESRSTRCNLAFDRMDPLTVFCASEYQVMKSTDGGTRWSLVADPNLGGISALAVSPQDNNSLFLGSSGLYVSTDGGKRWEEQSSGLGGSAFEFKVSPTNSSFLYAQGLRNTQLYLSQDGGRNWADLGSGRSLFFGTDAETLYSINGTDNLAISRDNGASWVQTALPRPDLWPISIAAHPQNTNRVYAMYGGQSGGQDASPYVYYSDDLGKTWLNSTGMQDVGNPILFFDQDLGRKVYAIGSGAASLSDDGGIAWEDCGEFPHEWWISNFDERAAVDPRDPNRLLIATRGYGIVVSDDACRSWTLKNNGLGSLFVNTIAIDPNNPDTVYAATDGGAYVSFDFGQTWNQINDGLLGATVVYSIVVDKDSNVYAATPYGIFKLESK